MSSVVTFKIYLEARKEKHHDIRMFQMNKTDSQEFRILKEKLVNVYPLLKKKLINITWKDTDGDKVSIGSNEELMIALNEMPGPVFKLRVKLAKPEDEIISTLPELDQVCLVMAVLNL